MPYRAGFQRDSATAETYTTAATGTTGNMIHGFLREAATDALRISGAATARWRCGFLRGDVVAGDGLGAVGAIQETGDLTQTLVNGVIVPLAPTVAATYWQEGFLREVGTGRLVWVLPGVVGALPRMWNGFRRTWRGDLILD